MFGLWGQQNNQNVVWFSVFKAPWTQGTPEVFVWTWGLVCWRFGKWSSGYTSLTEMVPLDRGDNREEACSVHGDGWSIHLSLELHALFVQWQLHPPESALHVQESYPCLACCQGVGAQIQKFHHVEKIKRYLGIYVVIWFRLQQR